MGKWFLRDWRSPQRVLTGTLTDVHDSSGILDGGDNDTNLEIVPRPETEFQDLLKNRFTPPQANKNGLIECEVNVGSDWRSQFEFFVNSLVGREVTAQGVFVDDDGHDSKTELHPVDVIFARVEDSQLPGDWIGALAGQRGLVLDQSLFVTRFAAASDDREGLVLSGPPLASWDRPTTFAPPLPPVPPGTGWVPDFSVNMLRQDKATIDPAVIEDPQGSGNLVIQVTITCQGRDYGGPGVAMGEIGTFWTSHTLPAIQISPTHISFDNVTVKDVASRTGDHHQHRTRRPGHRDRPARTTRRFHVGAGLRPGHRPRRLRHCGCRVQPTRRRPCPGAAQGEQQRRRKPAHRHTGRNGRERKHLIAPGPRRSAVESPRGCRAGG